MIDDLVFGENVLWELFLVGTDAPAFSKILSLDEDGEIDYEGVTSDDLLSIPDGEYHQVVTREREDGDTWCGILPDTVTIETHVENNLSN